MYALRFDGNVPHCGSFKHARINQSWKSRQRPPRAFNRTGAAESDC